MITYREVPNLSDAEILDYLRTSSFYCGDFYSVSEIRDTAKQLLECEIPKKYELIEFDKADTARLYREVVDYCTINQYFCPLICLYPGKSLDFNAILLGVPYNSDINAVFKCIKDNQNYEFWKKHRKDNPILNIFKVTLDVCTKLNINPPLFCPKNIGNSDAMIVFAEDTIYLNGSFTNKNKNIWVLAHELRHKWQLKNNVYDFSNYYHTSDLDKDIMTNIISEERRKIYWLQPMEVDANAYAYIYLKSQGADDNDIMEIKMHYGLKDEVWDSILLRAKQIECP